MVEVDGDDYHIGVYHLKFSVIRGLSLHYGDLYPTTMKLKNKLEDGLKIKEMKVIPTGKGVFYILLHSLSDQCMALTVGSLFLKPRVMRFNIWLPSFNVTK